MSIRPPYPAAPRRPAPFAALFAVLFTGMLIGVAAFTAWHMHAARQDALDALQDDARRAARRCALFMAAPAWNMDAVAARALVLLEMEDERVFAVRVDDRAGMLEGQTRNAQWEPVPWDTPPPETMLEGSHPLLLEEHPVGMVYVYLSPREAEEYLARLWRRLLWPLLALGGLSALGLYLSVRVLCAPPTPAPPPKTGSA